ncbi:MAG: signal recognition particle-docking protein FtsY [Verrucomicrobiia bacterium]
MTGFFKRLLARFPTSGPDLEELEEALIMADLGVPATTAVMNALRQRDDLTTSESVLGAAREEILRLLPPSHIELTPLADAPRVILLVGVNGTGKTTTAAKVAARIKGAGYSILLAAADTFRAAAQEQLQLLASYLQVPIHTGPPGSDPAAVCHDAYLLARKHRVDFLLCDTAGRLHTKENLMQQLGKISRTLHKLDPHTRHEHWLVADGGTGMNAAIQAREFHAAIGLTGVIFTKMDGSGKGGAIVAIAHETGVPTLFLGTGEGMTHLEPFDPERFIDSIL